MQILDLTEVEEVCSFGFGFPLFKFSFVRFQNSGSYFFRLFSSDLVSVILVLFIKR
jgi:hypothetical protein